MSIIASTILGAVTSFLPEVVSYFNKRQENQHKREILELEIKRDENRSRHEIDVVNVRADANEGESLRRHDASIGSNFFIDSLRGSVRPVITYCFFILYGFIKVAAMMSILDAQSADVIFNLENIINTIPLVWNQDDSAIFGAICGFWFGDRAIQRLRSSGRIN